jgi:hypothetical protein
MVRLSATRCSCVATLCVSPVSFAAIILCVASQRVFIVVISLSAQSGNFWVYLRIKFSRTVLHGVSYGILKFRLNCQGDKGNLTTNSHENYQSS